MTCTGIVGSSFGGAIGFISGMGCGVICTGAVGFISGIGTGLGIGAGIGFSFLGASFTGDSLVGIVGIWMLMSISIMLISGFSGWGFVVGCSVTAGCSFTGFSFIGASFTGNSFTCISFTVILFFSGTSVVGTFTFMPGEILSGFLICVLTFFSVSKSRLYFCAIFHKVSPFFTMWIFMSSTILSVKITLHHMHGRAICYGRQISCIKFL